MRRLPLIFVHLAVALALAAGSGAHLVVLQGIAWTGMLIKYSRDTSVARAVEMTFDGRHPCQLCVTVQKAESPQNLPFLAPETNPDLKAVLLSQGQSPISAPDVTDWAPWVSMALSVFPVPPVPPPRLA